jgi:malonyl-ACP O-methyltransferase BioC
VDKIRISQHFDQAASIYDWVATAQQQVAGTLTELILKHTQHSNCHSLCDVGTGTGVMAQLLLEKIPSIKHISLNDFADNMLQYAKNKLTPLIKPETQSIRLIYQDMDQLATEHIEPHDLITSSLALQWSNQLETTLNYLSSRSKILAFSCLSTNTFQEWRSLFEQLNFPSPTFKYPSVKELALLTHNLAAHGKKNVITHTQIIPMRFVSPRAFIHYLKNLGANTHARAQHQLSRQQWQEFLAHHQTELTVSYHVFFAVCF